MGSFAARLAAGAAVFACGAVASAASADDMSPAATHIVFRIDAPEIHESSSLVVSTTHDGLVYTSNDSGDGPRVYALDRAGRLVGTTTLAGVQAVDFEAMGATRDGSLVIGDIGDNDADRSSVQVYKIPQPRAGDHTVRPEKVTLRYADGARNAESMVYDSAEDAVLIITKELLGHVYHSPPDVFDRGSATLKRGAAVASYATDASWLPQHGAIVVRGYSAARVYKYPSWRLLRFFDLPAQKQGESIANVPGRPDVVWAGSEGADSAVWQVALPKLPAVPGYVDPTPASGSGLPSPPIGQKPAGPATEDTQALPVVAGAAACAAAVGGVTWAARRRHHAPAPAEPNESTPAP